MVEMHFGQDHKDAPPQGTDYSWMLTITIINDNNDMLPSTVLPTFRRRGGQPTCPAGAICLQRPSATVRCDGT